MPVIHSEPYQRSKMECFTKIVQAEILLIIFAKRSILFFDRVLNTLLDAKVYFFSYYISKLCSLIQKKVSGDHTPRFFFFAKLAYIYIYIYIYIYSLIRHD